MPDDARGSAVPRPRTDVAGLQAFLAVARAGSVSRAAARLGRTQPSISARLAGLERVWGTRLFRRVARGMVLTPEGARLLPLAEAVLRDLEQLDRAAGLPVAEPAELRVGAGDALGRERLPRALAELLRRRPRLEVRLREGPGPLLLEALRAGEIDLALVVAAPTESVGPEVDLAPWIESPVRVLLPAGRAPRRRRGLALRELARQRLVGLQPGSGFRRHLESAFAAAGLSFRPRIEVGNLSLVRRFVAAGLGVAPVPAVAFSERDAGPGVVARRLSSVPPLTYWRAVRARVPRPTVIDELLDLLRR